MSQTNLALGLLHFDVLAAPDPAVRHRYCTQVVLPLLALLKASARFRLTISVSGAGLEFLEEHYPDAIEALCELTASGGVELISTTYCAIAWAAFPARDLRLALQMSQRVHSRLGLQSSGVFCAHEGLFGAGVESIADFCEYALCKDTYLRGVTRMDFIGPIYRLGKLHVIVAANHILNEMASGAISAARRGSEAGLNSFHYDRIEEAVRYGPHSSSGAIEGSLRELGWHWYHAGSAHHFMSRGNPHYWDSFFCEPAWASRVAACLDGLVSRGWQFATVSSFAAALRQALGDVPASPLPAVVEAGWEPRASEGIARWMPGRRGGLPGASAVLAAVWRARAELCHAESRNDADLSEAWREQILAECSRGGPVQGAVFHAEAVLRKCAALAAQSQTAPSAESVAGTAVAAPVETELVGAEGSVSWYQTSPTSFHCEILLRPEGGGYGIRFKRDLGPVCYCPSGLEDQPRQIDLEALRPVTVFLPLANGFVSLARDCHLVRINARCFLPAQLSLEQPWVSFLEEAVADGRTLEWEFALIRGTPIEAAQAANEINNAQCGAANRRHSACAPEAAA